MLSRRIICKFPSFRCLIVRYLAEEGPSKPKATGYDTSEEVYIPREPCPSVIDQSKVEDAPPFDEKLITHLERLSLVRFSSEEAVAHLRKAVRYANQLKLVDTTGVEPMETILEDLECPLRDDVPDPSINKEEVLMNAEELVEDYFVTPPGNVPLEESRRLDVEKINNWDWMAMKKKKLS